MPSPHHKGGMTQRLHIQRQWIVMPSYRHKGEMMLRLHMRRQWDGYAMVVRLKRLHAMMAIGSQCDDKAILPPLQSDNATITMPSWRHKGAMMCLWLSMRDFTKGKPMKPAILVRYKCVKNLLRMKKKTKRTEIRNVMTAAWVFSCVRKGWWWISEK